MILLPALLVGYLAGAVRAQVGNRSFEVPEIRLSWLVTAAMVPQLLVFFVGATGRYFSQEAAAIVLVVSQIGLLYFVWSNRRHIVFWILGLGLALNLAVILANGGLMPISQATLAELLPQQAVESWPVGERLGHTKDILLPEAEIRLSWLADRFVTPPWYPQPTAFSLGDIMIALGVFGLFWQAGGGPRRENSINAIPAELGRETI